MHPQRVERLSHAQHERLAYIDFRCVPLPTLTEIRSSLTAHAGPI